MTDNTETGGVDSLCAENSAENYIKPTMDIYEALRWIGYGLPPLSNVQEAAFLYHEVLARHEEYLHIPEDVVWDRFRYEEAELKKALVMGRLSARGVKDDENDEITGCLYGAGALVDVSHWEWFEEWRYDPPYSRVNFGFHGWYGWVQFKTSDVIELFPRASRPERIYVHDNNDIYKYFDEAEVAAPEIPTSKSGRPTKDMTPVLKRIIILAMAGKFDDYLTKPRTNTSIYSVIAQDLKDNGMVLSDATIRKDYGIDKLIKEAREMRGKCRE
tara:strand:+ start:568 stop:1383 length:816 start_codon:yes stop_codon:yes gene_type:complete